MNPSISSTILHYANSLYQNPKLQLTTQEAEQLAWVQKNTMSTSEMSSLDSIAKAFHIEIPRCLSRLYCLEQLKAGNYDAFTIAQENNPNRLSLENFESLSKEFQSLDSKSFEGLRVATILSSITKSPEAERRAIEMIANPECLPKEDAVQWLSQTFYEAPEIYPLAKSYIEKYPNGGFELVKAALLPNTHFRHMMYSEGGEGMFKHLRANIANGQVDENDLNMWSLYWIVNITGFRGHINPMGSLYLDNNTYDSIQMLRDSLNELLQNSSSPIFHKYLEKRADLLELSHDYEPKERLQLASIACMLRLFTKEEGQQLQVAFKDISDSEKESISKQFELTLTSNEPTPIHGPSLFANALGLGMPLTTVIKTLLPVYATCLEAYRRKGDTSQPLSFRDISWGPNLKPFLERYQAGDICEWSMDEKNCIKPNFVEKNQLMLTQFLGQTTVKDIIPTEAKTKETIQEKNTASMKI